VTTVAFADRVGRSLTSEANQLLGADLVVVSDKPIAGRFQQGSATPQIIDDDRCAVSEHDAILRGARC
jgi:hypothetical protein